MKTIKHLLVAGFACIMLLSLSIVASANYDDRSTNFQDFMESFEIAPLEDQIAMRENFNVEEPINVVKPIIVATELPSDPRNVEVYDFNTNVITTYPYSDYEDKTITGTVGSPLKDSSDATNLYANGDTRIQITNVNSYKKVVYILSYYYDKDGKPVIHQGSGAAISKTGILTAGHAIYDHSFGWPYKVEVIPGGPNSNAATYTMYPRRGGVMTCPTGWTQEKRTDYDYAVLNFNNEFPTGVGHFGTRAYFNDSDLLYKDVYHYGFPGDKVRGTLWRLSGRIENLYETRQFIYTGYSNSGESGAPIVRQSDTEYIVGVYSGGRYYDDEYYNVAVRITDDLISFLVKYGGAERA